MDDDALKAIGDEKLDEIAGGYIFDSSVLSPSSYSWPWEVLNDKGCVVARLISKEDAEKVAKAFGLTTQELDWEQVQKLRETGSIN